MSDDRVTQGRYGRLMAGLPAHIVLTVETREPIEIGDFVGMYTGLANQFEKYIKAEHPDLASEAQLFVREVKPGSIVTDLIPGFVLVAPFIGDMEKLLTIEAFVTRFGQHLASYFGKGHSAPVVESASDLRDFNKTVAAIANDPNGSASLGVAVFEDGERNIRAAFSFNTRQARKAQREIERKLQDLQAEESANYRRVLMVFTRSDVQDAVVGKKSADRVMIEEISSKSLALIYASEMAEERIKHEIRDADDNVFKKGFIVDVNVQLQNGRPIGYRVVDVHQVIDLPER